jgi:hypothetical protein
LADCSHVWHLRAVAHPQGHARIVQSAVVDDIAPLPLRLEGVDKDIARISKFSIGLR